MNLNTNICEDWGWYFDTELNCYISANVNYNKILFNDLSSIEDEYNYYQQNYKDNEILDYDKFEEKSDSGEEIMYDACSMTIMAALLLTSVIFLFKSLN